ncbi:11661_t:CDS:2, partial [Acaulospora colombiana]
AAGLGFSIRSGVNIFLLIFKVFRTPKHALLGPDSFKFAAMLGTFVTLYKLLLNTLPLFSSHLSDFSPPLLPWGAQTPVTPAGYDSDPNWSLLTPSNEKGPIKFNLGDDTEDRPGEPQIDPSNIKATHEIWIRKKGRRWHAALAGTIAGGLAVLWEKRERRLVDYRARGMRSQPRKGSRYRLVPLLSSRCGMWIAIYSDVEFNPVYTSCGQIMYSWLLRPDTIPRSYSLWIGEAAKVLQPTVLINRAFTRTGQPDPKNMQELIDWKFTTPSNRTKIAQVMALTATGPIERRFSNCAETHPWLDSCTYVQIERFLEVFKWMFPIYGALHFVPALLFKRKEWAKDAPGMLWKNLLGTGRSSTFLGVFVIIYQIEAPRRRAELAMYVMPKALESAWVTARGRGWVQGGGRVGETILCAAGMGMVMSTYQGLCEEFYTNLLDLINNNTTQFNYNFYILV